jgi:tetratricopeptide (TPR) repeat protein
MKINPQILQIFGIGFAFGAFFFTGIIQLVFGRTRRSRELAEARAFSMRTGQVPRSYARVRQTDILSRLTRSEAALFRKAEKLESQKQYLEAAELLEKVRFQRRAVDILERAQLITEAAQVLLRLKAPGRAAAIYERNGRLELAAKYYQIANQHKEAGLVYLKMAASDSSLYSQAAECFTKGKEFDLALDALSQRLNHDEILRNAVMHARFGFLVNYMRNRENARAILAQIDNAHLEALVHSAPINPQTIQTFVTWTENTDNPMVTKVIVEYVSQERDFSNSYWMALSSPCQQKALERLQKLKMPGSDQMRRFCENLVAGGLVKVAAKIFFINEDYVEAANSYLQLGLLDKCCICVERCGPPALAEEAVRILGENTSGPWSVEQTAKITATIKKVAAAHASHDGAKNQNRLRKTEQAVQDFIDTKKYASSIGPALLSSYHDKKIG